jgi:hypothetical protein
MRFLLILTLGLVLARPVRGGGEESAEEEFVAVEVACTAISGQSVFLDQGRDAGIERGDTVRLYPLQGSARLGRIESVSRSGARARMERGVEGLDIGARGEVLVPRERLAQQSSVPEESPPVPAPSEEPVEEPPERPEHPGWTAPPEDWNQSMPLLAPAHGVDPDERPRRMYGRVFTGLDWTLDDGGPNQREYYSSRTGLDWTAENPFGHGGELEFEGEYFARSSDVEGGDDERDSRLRVDRLSYEWGGVRTSPHRTEVGRFLQREFPELGYLDGIEYAHRLRSGSRLGGSVGFMPVPDDLFRSGDDLQAALFYRYVSDESERFALGGGYQKTWHEGAADRDLLFATLDYHPSFSNSLYSSILLDYYSSGDDLKSSGLDVTQFIVNATHRTSGGHGLGAFFSHFAWPALERDEFPDVTAQQIMDNENTRLGLDGWYQATQSTRLNARADAWSDQDDSGGSGSLRVTLEDLLYRDGQVALEGFFTGGKFSDGVGLRASLWKYLERGSLSASWSSTQFDQSGIDEELMQHVLRFQGDLTLGEKWFLALYLESLFGDDQDTLSIGFLLQRRFY